MWAFGGTVMGGSVEAAARVVGFSGLRCDGGQRAVECRLRTGFACRVALGTG